MNFVYNLFYFSSILVPLIFSGILGAIIGSFLNVVILRHDTTENLGGRSHCTKCHYKLTARDLIPVLSWIFLRGRCRKCHEKISTQYPLVELGTAALFMVLFYYSFGFTIYPTIGAIIFAWNAVMFSILIAIFVYDLKHKIIPNKWSYTFASLALLQTLWLLPFQELFGTYFRLESILDLLAGPILFTPFFLLWYVSDGKWIGLGDGKLAIGIGWFLGFVRGVSAITLAFWIGAFFALGMMLIVRLNKGSRNITMKSEIPFGPFLIIGILIQFFWPIDMFNLSNLLF